MHAYTCALYPASEICKLHSPIYCSSALVTYLSLHCQLGVHMCGLYLSFQTEKSFRKK